jgi:hypothetical protein
MLAAVRRRMLAFHHASISGSGGRRIVVVPRLIPSSLREISAATMQTVPQLVPARD